MQTNKRNTKKGPKTHEGGRACTISPEQALRRSVMTCMLWEDTFYEEGEEIGKRIASLIHELPPETVAQIAIEAREKAKLRHAPLLVVREMARLSKNYKSPTIVSETLERVIQRPDELAEFLSIYWKDGRCKLSSQVKRGLAKAFNKFNEYSFAKYDRPKAVRLRDVMFLTHPKPKDTEQAKTFMRLAQQTLTTPDTWEVALSAAGSQGDKLGIWTRLLQEKKLGALALLRNLRNMTQVGVDPSHIRTALKECDPSRVLPFRFIAAARYAPQFEPELEALMFKCIAGAPKLAGHTVLLVDHSGSMQAPISLESDLNRVEAACGLAILARELCETVSVFTFADQPQAVPARRGFALRDAIMKQPWGGTYLDHAMEEISVVAHDRLIVLSDEQVADDVRNPAVERAYMINVAAYQNGVGYKKWVHIDGWSEACLQFIQEFEQQ